jgi:hypothetical protein
MNNISEFIKPDNVEILWEVILDENVINTNDPNQLINIKNYFNNQLRTYYEGEKMNPNAFNLFQLNKNFISNFITNIHTQQNQQNQQKPHLTLKNPSLTSGSQQKPDLITSEDIHTDRKNQFDNDLAARVNEFQSAMALPIPEAPKFSDKLDKPINEMEALIAQTLAQRNFEIEQIHKGTNKNDAEKWLKGEITSIKSNKNAPKQQQINHSQEINYIQIGENMDSNNITKDIITLPNNIYSPSNSNSTSTLKKSISWATNDNNIKLSIAEEPVVNIFSKLKSVASVTPVSVPYSSTDVPEYNQKTSGRDATIRFSPTGVTKELDSLKIEFALMNKKLDSILEILSLRSVAEDIPSASAFGI